MYYQLTDDVVSGLESAKHLNRHPACTAVRLIVPPLQAGDSQTPMPAALTFLRHASDSTPSSAAGSLSALRSLTSLELWEEEREQPSVAMGRGMRPYSHPAAAAVSAHHAHAPRRALWRIQHVRPPVMQPIIEAFSGLPLRSLELMGRCRLGAEELKALSEALPHLEQLRISALDWFQLSPEHALDADKQHGGWHMPYLKSIVIGDLTVAPMIPSMVAYPPEALYLTAGCPSLERLSGAVVSVDLGKDAGGASTSTSSVDMEELRRWVHGLAALAARGVLAGDVQLVLKSTAHAEAVCMVLDVLQPADQCAALAGCIQQVLADEVAEAALGRLLARLPMVREVHCPTAALPGVASIPTVAKLLIVRPPTPPEAYAALQDFVVLRLAALNAGDAARPVVVHFGLGCHVSQLRACVQAGAVQFDGAARRHW